MPKTGNGLIQMKSLDKSTGQRGVKVYTHAELIK